MDNTTHPAADDAGPLRGHAGEALPQPPDAGKHGPPYSPYRVENGFVFTSGHTPRLSAGEVVSATFEGQAHEVFTSLRATLDGAGCTSLDVLKINAYLHDLRDIADFNRIYLQYFQEPLPARTTVQAGLPGFLIEVDAIALLTKN